MDIHSNEVKAINNSGGNAYPHLVPFLLKSSVCNKRSSRSREKEKERERGCVRKKEERDEYKMYGKRGERGGKGEERRPRKRERMRDREREENGTKEERERSRGTGRYAPRNILEYLRNLVAGH